MVQPLTKRTKVNSSASQKAPLPRVRKKGTTVVPQKRFTDLSARVTPILRPYVNRISVFGSFARGDATPESDIDLLIALKPAEARPMLGLIEFIKIEQALGKELGCKVDLVTEEEVNHRRRQNIEKDRVVLYEAK
jgi:predicted nucleotidyltransferase